MKKDLVGEEEISDEDHQEEEENTDFGSEFYFSSETNAGHDDIIANQLRKHQQRKQQRRRRRRRRQRRQQHFDKEEEEEDDNDDDDHYNDNDNDDDNDNNGDDDQIEDSKEHRFNKQPVLPNDRKTPPRSHRSVDKNKKRSSVLSPANTEPESDIDLDDIDINDDVDEEDDGNEYESNASVSTGDDDDGEDDDDDDDDDEEENTVGTSTATEGGEGFSVLSKETDDDDGDEAHANPHRASSSVISSASKSQHHRILRRLQLDDPSLTELTVNRSLLEQISIAELGKVIPVNSSVVLLTLDLPRGIKLTHILALLKALEFNDTIASLCLRNIPVCRYVATALSTYFSKTPSLIKLQLNKCPFVESGLALLFMGLQHCSTLSTLSVDTCNLGGYSVDVVAATIPLLELSSVQLQQTSLRPPGLEFLLRNMQRVNSLKCVDLSRNDVIGTKEGIRLLVDALELIPLQRLILQDCDLQRPAVKTLCQEALHTHPKLRFLDLSYNTDLDDRTAKYLCKLLDSNPKIVELSLKGCGKISRIMLSEMSDKLRYNNSFLKTIGFSSDVSLAILDSMQLLKNITK
jgi:hypothetical protein